MSDTDPINSYTCLKPHICKVCNDSFNSEAGLKRHVKNHSNEQTQPHVFQPGHYPFTISTEKDDPSYQCNICRRKFKTEYGIMYHLAYITGIKGFNCQLCGKGFITNKLLESHLQRVHENECPFKCSVCKLGFPQQDYLEDHIKSTHTSGSKFFKCKVCNEGFSLYSKLKAHSLKHTNERPFSCTKCDNKFKSRRTLDEHMKRHNEPTLSCQHWDKVFKVRMDLRRHQQVHGGGQRYLCRRCSASFFLKIHFERHLKIHERQDKIRECLKNEFKPIAEQPYHNANVDTQETPTNVIIQETNVEKLQIQHTCEAIAYPVADTQDPVPDFGRLSNNVVWIESQSFSTINAFDWSLLGDQKKQPEAVVTDSLAAEKSIIITSAPVETSESTHIPVAFSPMDQTVFTIPYQFSFTN